MDGLVQWLEDTCGDDDLTELIKAYLCSQGETTLADLLHKASPYTAFIADQGKLGWDSFIEGRVAKSLLGIHLKQLSTIGFWLKNSTWATTFIWLLLDMTHKQWGFWNTGLNLTSLKSKNCIQHLENRARKTYPYTES